jgi:outer membrane autotransporter protein
MDWKDALQLGQFSLSPYAAYTWMRTQVDAYTEQGGAFAARFDSNNLRTNDFRIGAASLLPISVSTDLRLAAETIYLDNSRVSGNNGQVIGLSNFNFQADNGKKTSARLTADLDTRVTDNALITIGASAGTNSSNINWGLTAGLRANF